MVKISEKEKEEFRKIMRWLEEQDEQEKKRMSENIKVIPVNPEGALELGMCPCEACDFHRAIYDSNGKVSDCRGECEYWEGWIKKEGG